MFQEQDPSSKAGGEAGCLFDAGNVLVSGRGRCDRTGSLVGVAAMAAQKLRIATVAWK